MKRTIAFLLAVFMLISMLPAALAYSDGTATGRCPGHKWSYDPERDPTCTKTGITHRVCTICNKYEQVTLPALGHNWGEKTNIVDPTCTENGHYDVTCKRCGFTGTFRIDALGHEFGEWYIVTEAKPGQPGLKRRDCIRSDKYEEAPYTVDDPDQPLPPPETDPTDPVVPTDPTDPVTPPVTPEGSVTIILNEVSSPKNGTHYSVDIPERIDHAYTIYSTYPDPITILDIRTNEGGVRYVGPNSGTIGEAYSGSFSYFANIVYTHEDFYPVSGPLGGYAYSLVLTYTTADGQELTATSNRMIVGVGCDHEGQADLTVTKKVTNTPERGYFLPGETVEFEAVITNSGDKKLPQIHMEDPHLAISSTYIEPLAPGDSINMTFEMFTVVGQPDSNVETWTEENVIVVTSETEDGEPVMGLGSVTYECRAGTVGLSVFKYETSVPANGMYYVENECIHYGIRVTNPGTATLKDAVLEDPLLGLKLEIPSIAPGETWTCPGDLFYCVTAADVEAGTVTNEVVVRCKEGGVMDIVFSPTGEGELPQEAVLTKKLIGQKPQRGYFVEGETMTFAIIFTNYGDTEIESGGIRDVLDSSFIDGFSEPKKPGDSMDAIFTYTVTAEDVAAGKVINWATAEFGNNIIESNHVVVPCGKEGTILGDESWCERTLTGHNDAGDVYAQTYCAVHSGVKAQADALPAAEAIAVWREAVDDLYIRWIEKVALNEDLNLQARTERTTFLDLCDVLAANATEAGSKALAKLLEDKCTDLCYLLNNPVTEQRADIQSDDVPAINLAAPEGACICAADDQNVTTSALCTAHADIPVKAEALLAKIAEPSEAMRYAALTAETLGYQNAVNRINPEAAKALAAYVEAARENLGAIYGNGTLLVGELAARTAREVLLAVCAGK